MVDFFCDNKKIENLLRKLYDIVKAEGAYIRDDIGVVCKEGQFSVVSSVPLKPRQGIIVLPESATVRAEEFKFDFQDNRISILSHSDGLSASEIEIMGIALEIYNINHKLAYHRNVSILSLYFQDPDLFHVLVGYCRWEVFDGMEHKSETDLLGRNFMKLRLMEKSKGGKTGIGTSLLLPFIEYFNHHPLAPMVGEYTDKTNNSSVFEVSSAFFEGNNDLSICYGIFDCFDLFVLQGFVDSNPFFVRSRPMSFEVPNIGTLEIYIQLVRPAYKNLPEEIRDIAFYLPQVKIDWDRKIFYLGYVLFPPDVAPQALRRVLKFVFDQIAETDEQSVQAVLFAEKQIIERNLAYYNDLLERLKAYKPPPATREIIENAQKMARLQIGKIESYAAFSKM